MYIIYQHNCSSHSMSALFGSFNLQSTMVTIFTT